MKITIREAGTQQPLLGAHITIAPHKEHQDTLIVITDKDGKAFINLEKENASYFYKVNMMGYMPVSGTLLATEKEVNIVLKEDVMHLNGVVVTVLAPKDQLSCRP